MKGTYSEAAQLILSAKNLITLTGAGISVESGIPDFRGKNGLWAKYDPFVYAHIDVFRRKPETCWEMLSEMKKLTRKAKPNPAHTALAQLEAQGLLKAVITQNVDHLHQDAGSRTVIEFHGNDKHYQCIRCDTAYNTQDVPDDGGLPKCKRCASILKPAVVFFGETIPPEALSEAFRLAEIADVVIVAGTSAQVQPAAHIPVIAKRYGAAVIEMNLERTGLTGSVTDLFIEGYLGTTLPKLVAQVTKQCNYSAVYTN